MAEESEGKDKSNLLNSVVNSGDVSVTSEKGIDRKKAFENDTMEENTLDTSVKNIDLSGSRDEDDSDIIDEDARLTWALSLGNDADLEDLDDACVNEASKEGNGTDDIDDESRDYDTTLENEYEDTDHDVGIINSTEDDNCIDISDELTKAIESMRIDPMNVECEARNKNNDAADLSEEIKKEGPTVTEKAQVKFARIVFDATDMDKGCKIMRLKADSSMKEIKKLFPKHLNATEDTFMLQFNNREVENETPLQLFGDNLEGDNNVIKIVKSIKIRLGGHPGRYLDERPNTLFSLLRWKIARFLKEPQALIGLAYNGKEILNEQTPESVKMVHGHVLEIIKKDKMKIRFRGSIFKALDGNLSINVDPNTTKMREIKAKIASCIEEDQRKIMFIYKDREVSDHTTPDHLGMSDTDILSVILKVGAIIKVKGPVGGIQRFYLAETPLKALLQTYSALGKRSKSFVFRLNGVVVNDEDTVKSLNMVDGDCITACEKLTLVFQGSVLRKGVEVHNIDTQMKFGDIRKHFSDQTGVDFEDLVFTIAEDKRVVGDDDTLESLNRCNGFTFISVSVEQYIQVECMYFQLGQVSQTFTSKIRLGKAMQEWKYEISAGLGESVNYLSFMWNDSNIEDLETPERIGIQNGDKIVVTSSSVIEIHIEKDGEVMGSYIPVDLELFGVAKLYSQQCHVGLNSFGFKFGERYVEFAETPNEIGLAEGGTIQVFQKRQKNVMTIEFYVENSDLLPISPRLNYFPLLWDASTVDQVFLLKFAFGEFVGFGSNPSWIIFLHNGKEMNDGETLQEIGLNKDDKIGFDVKADNHDEKETTVYVKRNMKETKSSMGNGLQHDDDELCAFKLDSSKPLSEFIKKVKSRIICNSKKDNLFLSLNGAMVNKDDLGGKLQLVPYESCFESHAFPNLKAFKKHLETSYSENMSFEYNFDDSDFSFSSEDSDVLNYKQNEEESLSNEDPDFPVTPPNYKHNHSDEKSSAESKKDIEKKLKAIQMRMKIDKKKKEKNDGISLAKDIQNHKNFENVDDILKFIGEEEVMPKTSKETKDPVGSSKRRKGKNKKRIKTPTTSKDMVDKSEIEDSNRDDLVVEVSIGQDNIGDDNQDQILDVSIEDNKDPRNKLSENGKKKIDLDSDGDGCNSIENRSDFENIKVILDSVVDADEDSTTKTTEGNDVKVRSLEMKKQMNSNRKETNSRESAKNVMENLQDKVGRSKDDEQSEMKDIKNKGKKQKRKNQSKSKVETNHRSNVCNTCTFINHRDTIFCDVCGDDLMIDEQNWQKVSTENKKKNPTKTQSKDKINLTKLKTTPFSHSDKLLQKPEPKITPFSHHEKLLQELDLKTKDTCFEKYVSESIRPGQHVPAFCREDSKQSKGDVIHTKLKQVESKTEIFLESEKDIEFPKINETLITNKFTSKGNQSRKDVNNRKKWTAPERHDYRQPINEIDNKIPEENKYTEPDPELTETEEETIKWCQSMVAARKRKDEERKRDYLKFLDMQARNTSPQMEQTHHEGKAQMFCDQLSSGTNPVVPQPKGTVKYYSGNTQGASIPRQGWPQGLCELGRPFEANHRPNPPFYQRWQ